MRLRRRRPRCERCGKPLSGPEPERSVRQAGNPAAVGLCDWCTRWTDTLNTDWDALAGDPVELCHGWLSGAPLTDHPTDPVAASAASGYVSGRPFVEITDLETAAANCARGDRGVTLPASTYQDVLTGSYDQPPVSFTFWIGSVSRLADGRVVFHWRPRWTGTNTY